MDSAKSAAAFLAAQVDTSLTWEHVRRLRDLWPRKLLLKGEDIDTVLEALSKGITQKMLHGAMAELRAGDPAARDRASAAVHHFFLRKER